MNNPSSTPSSRQPAGGPSLRDGRAPVLSAPAAKQKQRILKARADALARESASAATPRNFLEVVAFSLGQERYGIESAYVREVYPLSEFTPLPATPPFVLGIVNVRGQILSVIDLKKFFDLPEKGLTDLNKVIIIRKERMEFGLLADAVQGIRLIAPETLQPSLPTLSGVREKYLRGVTPDCVMILDAPRLLQDETLVLKDDTTL